MGLFTNLQDQQLEEGRKQVTAGDVVCPSCKTPFVKSGATLVAWNASIGLEMHRCPACGHSISMMHPAQGDI